MAFINTSARGSSSAMLKGNPLYILLITLVATLGGLLFGYDTAVVNGAEKSLVGFFISGMLKPESYTSIAVPLISQYRTLLVVILFVIGLIICGQMIKLLERKKGAVASLILLLTLSYWSYGFLKQPLPVDAGALKDTADAVKGFVIASALIGCIIGGASAGWISNALGRRIGLFIAAIAFLVSAVGSWHPEAFNVFGTMDVYSFTIYRIIGGVGVGIASMISPMYIAEIAPASTRGKLISFNQFAIVFGIFTISIVNYLIKKQGDETWLITEGWRWMFFSGAIPAALFFVLLFFVPETPRYLVLKGKDEKALEVLTKLANADQAILVLAEIKSTKTEKNAPWLSYGFGVIFLGIMLSVFQQFVGINVVFYYSANIFRDMGANTDTSLLQTILVGAVNVFFTIVAIATVDKLGRKPLMIVGSVVMAISMVGLGITFYLHHVGLLSLVFMLVYIAAFGFSWGPVCWVLLAEIFPNSIRSAMSIAIAAQWIANWIVSFTFPIMNDNQLLTERFNHGFAYWIYALMAVLSAVFMWKFIPETKGKTLEEIEQLWKKK